jgi:hypothetical protein
VSEQIPTTGFLTPDHPPGVKPLNHKWLIMSQQGHRQCKWCGITQRPEEVIEHEAMKSYETWIHVAEDNPKPWHALQPAQRAVWRQGAREALAPA